MTMMYYVFQISLALVILAKTVQRATMIWSVGHTTAHVRLIMVAKTVKPVS